MSLNTLMEIPSTEALHYAPLQLIADNFEGLQELVEKSDKLYAIDKKTFGRMLELISDMAPIHQEILEKSAALKDNFNSIAGAQLIRQIDELTTQLGPLLTEYNSLYYAYTATYLSSRLPLAQITTLLDPSKADNLQFFTNIPIKPCQRLPRYEMYTKDLLKVIGPEHPAYTAVQQWRENLRRIGAQVDATISHDPIAYLDLGMQVNRDSNFRKAIKSAFEDKILDVGSDIRSVLENKGIEVSQSKPFINISRKTTYKFKKADQTLFQIDVNKHALSVKIKPAFHNLKGNEKIESYALILKILAQLNQELNKRYDSHAIKNRMSTEMKEQFSLFGFADILDAPESSRSFDDEEEIPLLASKARNLYAQANTSSHKGADNDFRSEIEKQLTVRFDAQSKLKHQKSLKRLSTCYDDVAKDLDVHSPGYGLLSKVVPVKA